MGNASCKISPADQPKKSCDSLVIDFINSCTIKGKSGNCFVSYNNLKEMINSVTNNDPIVTIHFKTESGEEEKNIEDLKNLISNNTIDAKLIFTGGVKVGMQQSDFDHELAMTKLFHSINTTYSTLKFIKTYCAITIKLKIQETQPNLPEYINLLFQEPCSSGFTEENFQQFIAASVVMLKNAHDNNMYLNDIKLENIVLCGDKIKFIDFRQSRVIENKKGITGINRGFDDKLIPGDLNPNYRHPAVLKDLLLIAEDFLYNNINNEYAIALNDEYKTAFKSNILLNKKLHDMVGGIDGYTIIENNNNYYYTARLVTYKICDYWALYRAIMYFIEKPNINIDINEEVKKNIYTIFINAIPGSTKKPIDQFMFTGGGSLYERLWIKYSKR